MIQNAEEQVDRHINTDEDDFEGEQTKKANKLIILNENTNIEIKKKAVEVKKQKQAEDNKKSKEQVSNLVDVVSEGKKENENKHLKYINDNNKNEINDNNSGYTSIKEIEIVSKNLGNLEENELFQSVDYFNYLFYSMKFEIKTKEFFSIIEVAIFFEITLWVVSACIYYLNSNKSPYIWLHVLHILRSVFGIVLTVRLPKSLDFIHETEASSNIKYQPILHNFYHFKSHVVNYISEGISDNRGCLLFYCSITFLNFIIDVFDFIYNLTTYPNAVTNLEIIVVAVYQLIAVLYISKYVYDFLNSFSY